MKKINVLVLTLACLMFSTISCANDKPIPVDKLPVPAKAFVEKHFQGKSIVYAEKDGRDYECRLSDGTKVAFNKKGDWKNVDANDKTAVPAVLVPSAIMQYVASNFPGSIITKIEKERYGYDIELSNDLELKFNHQGALLRIDD